MTSVSDPESIDRFVLRWHRAAITFSPAALPRWLLASLAAMVAFSGGLWVVGVGAVGPARAAVVGKAPPGRPGGPGEPGEPAGIAGSLHTVGLSDAALSAGEHHWLVGQALGVAAADPGRAAVAQLPASVGSLQTGQPLLVLREPDAPADRQQMLVLLRGAHEAPFGVDERRLLERLAPHAMQAVTTARVLAEARGGVPGADGAREAPAAAPAAVAPDPALRILRPMTGATVPDVAVPPGAPSLEAIERAVARLYAAGQTDREITVALALPPGVVREHLRQVFAKLGVASRAQVGAALDGPIHGRDDA